MFTSSFTKGRLYFLILITSFNKIGEKKTCNISEFIYFKIIYTLAGFLINIQIV